MSKFVKDIEPVIQDLVNNTHQEVFLKLYMIGSREAKSRPTIMICCRDAKIAKQIESAIRDSELFPPAPGFFLGRSPVPLEEKVASRRLAGVDSTARQPGGSAAGEGGERFEVSMHHDSDWIRAGVHLSAVSVSTGRHMGTATSGVLFKVGTQICQLTAGHITDPEQSVDDAEEDVDCGDINWSECHYGFPSDSEGEYDNSDGHSDTTILGYSGRSTAAKSSAVLAQGRGSDLRATEVPPLAATMRFPVSTSPAIPIGTIAVTFLAPRRKDLDYAVVEIYPRRQTSLEARSVAPHLEWIRPPYHPDEARPPPPPSRRPPPRRPADNKSSKDRPVWAPAAGGREVIIVTRAGLVDGVWTRGTTWHFSPGMGRAQNLQSVELDDDVAREGDCGAAVVEAGSLALLGHIVRGCPGTALAYFVQAWDVFEDIRQNVVEQQVSWLKPVGDHIPRRQADDDLHGLSLRELMGGGTAHRNPEQGPGQSSEQTPSEIGPELTSEDLAVGQMPWTAYIF